MPREKVLRTIKPTPLKGTLKMKDIERAVEAVKRQRPKPEPNALFDPLPDEDAG